ncbi:MAG: DUF6057 family protein [Tannerella sp.]|nr:DUF6057 family protein [Tannerella sp.]
MRKLQSVGFFALLWLASSLFLENLGRFHFLYIEQDNLFVHDIAYFLQLLTKPGGMADYVACFLIQYFEEPYCGAMVVGFLTAVQAALTVGIVRRIAPKANIAVCGLLPAAGLLLLSFNVNFYVAGVVAFCLMTAAIYLYLYVKRKTIYGVAAAGALFWLCGAVGVLFGAIVAIIELTGRLRGGAGFLPIAKSVLPLALAVALASVGVMFAWTGEYRFLFLPDGYFISRLRPEAVVYFHWGLMVLVVTAACIMRRRQSAQLWRRYVEIALQVVVVGAFFAYGMKRHIKLNEMTFKELDYYARTEQWDSLIERAGSVSNNYLYKCYLNVALAQRGVLADRMFAYDQRGVKGLVLPLSLTSHVATLLSDVYFAAGYMALAQRMAFEANVGTRGLGNPRMYRRLIQTNLASGAYPVAEKYITLLEKTRNHRDWARSQRRFLYNDLAIDADSLLSLKRGCLSAVDNLSEIDGLDNDLLQISLRNPAHKASIEYVGSLYLLDKQMNAFKTFVEDWYGTESLPVLPKSFQEAVIILAEQDTVYRQRFGVSEDVSKRFVSFRSQVLAGRSSGSALPGLLYRSFGDTYWYYYMFITSD